MRMLGKSTRTTGKKWLRIRKQILKRDNYLCLACLALGRYIPAEEVDHKIPISQGGSDDPSNLQSLCSLCHREKTDTEVAWATGKPKRSKPVRLPCLKPRL
jgi:5-methylcytosine-specific restriction protein A